MKLEINIRKVSIKKIIYIIPIILLCSCSQDEPLRSVTSLDQMFVRISSPASNLLENEEIILQATISRPEEQDISNLAMIIESNVDGTLQEGIVPISGEIEMRLTNLSRNVHLITLSIINEQNDRITAKKILNYAIKLEAVNPSTNGITLQWQNYFEDEFEKFELHKSSHSLMQDPEQVAVFNNNDVFSYEYNYEQLGQANYFQIIGISPDTTILSTLQLIEEGESIQLNVPVQEINYDPIRDRIFAISNLEFRTGHEAAYFTSIIDRSTLTEISRIDGITYDMCIDEDNNYLFLAGGYTLQRVNLDDLSTTSLPIEGYVYRLDISSDDRLFYQLRDPCRYCTISFTGEELWSMNFDGTEVTKSTREYNFGDFIFDDFNQVVFHEDPDSRFERFLIKIENNQFLDEDFNDIRYNSENINAIDWDQFGESAITSGKLMYNPYPGLSSSSSVIAYSTFDDKVLTRSEVIHGNTGEVIRQLPGGFSVGTFIDASTVILGQRREKTDYNDDGTSNRYIQSTLYLYEL